MNYERLLGLKAKREEPRAKNEGRRSKDEG